MRIPFLKALEKFRGSISQELSSTEFYSAALPKQVFNGLFTI